MEAQPEWARRLERRLAVIEDRLGIREPSKSPGGGTRRRADTLQGGLHAYLVDRIGQDIPEEDLWRHFRVGRVGVNSFLRRYVEEPKDPAQRLWTETITDENGNRAYRPMAVTADRPVGCTLSPFKFEMEKQPR